MASDSMERKLHLRQRLEMKLHFMVCSLCRRYFKQLHLLRELAQKYEVAKQSAPDSELSAEARERMKRMFDVSP